MARPSMASNSSGFPFLEHRHAVDPILITYAVVSHLATGNSLLTASMGIFQYIEWSLGTLLSYARGHDAALLTRSPAFAGIPESIEVSSDIGPSDTHFSIEHTGHGSEGKRNLFPGIEWSAPVALKNEIKEYLVMIEDPDAPIPPRIMQAVHGILYQIPASRTSITQDDLRVASNNNSSNEVRGGFKYGKLIHPVPYAVSSSTFDVRCSCMKTFWSSTEVMCSIVAAATTGSPCFCLNVYNKLTR